MAGAINLANVALGFDASQVTKGVDLSASEIRKLGSVVKASVSDIDHYANEMKILDVAQQKGAITADRLAQAQEHLAKKYGVETYAMTEARQASEKLEQKQREELETQKRLDAELAQGLALRKQVATGQDLHSQAMREYEVALSKGIIGQSTYIKLLEQSARKHGVETNAIREEREALAKLEQQQKEELAIQKKVDAELSLGISLRNRVATAEEKHTASVREYDVYLSKAIIDQRTYNRLVDQSAKSVVAMDNAPMKSMSMRWTEMASAISLARQGIQLIGSAIRPVFDEMNRIDAINDQAHKLGMSYRDLNTIQLSLGESSGLAADDIAKAMQKLSIGVSEAISTGKGSHFDALKTLGIEASALAAKPQVDQLATIADAMKGIASQSERLKLTFDLFGKTGAGLVSSFDEGGGKLREMAEFADKVGLNLSGPVVEGINNANDSLARLSMATQGWMAQFSGGLAPSIGAIARDMTGMVSDAKALAKIGEDAGLQLAKNYAIWKDIMALNYNPKIAANWMAGKGELMPTYEKILDDIAKAQIQASDDAATKYGKNKQLGERADQTAKEEATAKELKATIQLFYEKAKLENDRINDENKKKADYDAKEKKIWDDAGERDLKARFGNKNPMNISDTIAPALKSGSVEAYKFMLNQKDKAADIAEKQRQLAEESKDILNQQLDALNKMPQLRLAR